MNFRNGHYNKQKQIGAKLICLSAKAVSNHLAVSKIWVLDILLILLSQIMFISKQLKVVIVDYFH